MNIAERERKSVTQSFGAGQPPLFAVVPDIR
jgi:hypothetical protein